VVLWCFLGCEATQKTPQNHRHQAVIVKCNFIKQKKEIHFTVTQNVVRTIVQSGYFQSTKKHETKEGEIF